MGILADRIGLKQVLVVGLCIFAATYLGMGYFTSSYAIAAMFFLYGIYAAATEGISKAWITNIADKKDTATAIGTFTGFQSICTMLASSLAGIIWMTLGASATFTITGIAAAVVASYFAFFVGNGTNTNSR